MGAAFVRTTGKVETGGAGSLAGSFGALPAAGNFVLVQIFGWNSANNLDFFAGGCTDNQGNTYLEAIQQLNITSSVAIFYAENIGTPSGTFTVTVDPAGASGPLVMVVTEWSGMPASGSFDVWENRWILSTTPDIGPTPVTAQSDELIAAIVTSELTQASITVETVTPPFTERCEELDGSSFQPGECVTRVVNETGPQTCLWTLATNANAVMAIAAFRVAPSADSSDIFRYPSA